MEKTSIDARGKMCPQPLIMAKKALVSQTTTENFILLIDNETARENVERYLADNGVSFQTQFAQGCYSIQIAKNGQADQLKAVDEYCAIEPKPLTKNQDHTICITSAYMGCGDNQLGALLMQAFINTIIEVSPLPTQIIFYNAAVQLTIDESPQVDALRALEKKGVKLLICGTCTDFYQLKEKISIGTITNMYTILEALSDASKIINP